LRHKYFSTLKIW